MCELYSYVRMYEGDSGCRGGEWYSGGVGPSNESRWCEYARMLGRARRTVGVAERWAVWIVERPKLVPGSHYVLGASSDLADV